MLKKLRLRQKFTILLLVVLVLGMTLSGLTLSTVLKQNAKEQIASQALTLMDTISSVRDYTVLYITPELQDKLKTKFLPQTVAAFSATTVFEILRKKPEYHSFFYKEAALNPTNLRDKADSFETEIIERFLQKKELKNLSGFRSFPGNEVFYIARPLVVSQPSCLQCHSSPKVAPKTMIEQYGKDNGFGWHLNDIVAAQIVYVPASTIIQKAHQSSALIVGLVSLVFIIAISVVNFFLNNQIIRPLKKITRVAEEVSTGHLDVEFEQLSEDEIGHLAKAFKRMKFSLEMAIKRLKNSQLR
jgi:HAMP domain-containing protein